MKVHPTDASWQMMRAGGRDVARLTCPRCQGHQDINMSVHLPTDVIMKKFQKQGWTVDVGRADKCLCPDCFVSRKKEINKVREAPKMAEVFPTLAPQLNGPGAAKEEPLTIPVNMLPRKDPTVITTPLSQSHRMKIREMLDINFDDAAGLYLDGMTDQGIAEKIGCAKKHVEDIRKLAYGELKEDPELAQLRAALESASKLHREVGRSLLALEDRIVAVEKRMGLRP